MSDTIEMNKLTEEQIESKLDVLFDKKEKTDDEKKEFVDLKKERSMRYQKAIDKATSKQKEADYKAKQAQDELDRVRAENEELKKPKIEVKDIIESKVKVGNEEYYTDRALASMVEAGKLTDAEAFQHQKEREKADTVEKAYKRIKDETAKEEGEKVRNEDREFVLKEYPQFNKDHPDHDPNDPLYKEATRLWHNGYRNNPRGLSESIKDAKRILNGSKKEDLSDEHNVYGSGGVSRISKDKSENVTLTQYEEDVAKKQYCRGDVLNPKTKRQYTEKEAIERMLTAKKARLASG